MRPILPLSFFNRPTVEVARDLIGKTLVRRFPDGTQTALRITETEAYDGPLDLACHAAKGRTPRTEVMYGPAGHFYVYFIYGIHWLLNVVTGPEDFPSAVLIRAVEGISGPARVTKALKIDKSFYGKPVVPESGLWFEDRGEKVRKIKATPRIGVDYAGEEWAGKEWRFVVEI